MHDGQTPTAPTLPGIDELPDHASEADHRDIAIDKVGIRRLRYPIQVRDRCGDKQATVATIGMYVGLPASATGTHMSRFVEILNSVRGEITIRNLPDLLSQMQRRLGAEDAYVEMDFPYFIDKRAPVSGAASLMTYDCGFRASRIGRSLDFALIVRVPVTTLCPCSKAVSDRGAHNQRGEVEVELRSADFIWIEDVVEAVEGCASAPLYALLKRSDEKHVTEQAYDNPRFVEDMVREVLLAVRRLGQVHAVRVAAENFESIHNHSAFAELDWRGGLVDAEQLALPLASDSPTTQVDFGAWLRAAREARATSQAELAERVGVNGSFLSKLERGQKQATEELLERLAEALCQDPDRVKLRAGVVPSHLLNRVQGSPESFLRWCRSASSPDAVS